MADTQLPQRAVYAIICTDGRAYVGGTTGLNARWRQHRSELRRGVHPNAALQSQWDRLGEAAFTFSVLEGDPPGDLAAAEQRHMDRLRAEGGLFNHAPLAGTQRGIVHTDQTRAKVSAANRARFASAAARERAALAQIARFKDPEQRRLLGAAISARFADPSERAKHSAALKGVNVGERNAAAKLTDRRVGEIRRLAGLGLSQREIGERLGLSQPTISRAIRGKTWAHVA